MRAKVWSSFPPSMKPPHCQGNGQKGIRTDKGNIHRWFKKTNALLREAKQKIVSLHS